MAILLGIAGALVLVLLVSGAAMAILTWLILKWMVILFAIVGGIAGGFLFGEKGGVLLGAILGVAVAIFLLVAIANREKQ